MENGKSGIWKFESIANNIDKVFQLSLNEGNTPVEKIIVDGQEIFIKREDSNPNESFKDRSLAYQIASYIQRDEKNFVISSSGNAARSAIAYCRLHNSKLTVYVSESIPDYKYRSLLDENTNHEIVSIIKSKRPKSDAIKFALNSGAVNLRGSKDNLAIVGFKTIAYELGEQVPDADALFICCSSGTSTLGIYEGYCDLDFNPPTPVIKGVTSECPPDKGDKVGYIPQLHIVQSTKIHPIASEFDKDVVNSDSSLTNAISDKVAHRKKSVIEVVKSSNGNGWVVSDEEIINAKEIMNKSGIDVKGYNAYVGFAGYLKAIKSGLKFSKPVILVSGI